MDFTFRPITLWPGELAFDDHYRRSPFSFKAGYDDTIRRLSYELDHLGAKSGVIQLALDETDIRLDGLPRAHANPRHPGVIVSFDSRHGPLRYATDEFVLWQHNLRAIALGLEALRKVDRYGIGEGGEQYTGWKALPPGDDPDPARGRELIREHGSEVAALKATHPDHGGNERDFMDVQAARKAA